MPLFYDDSNKISNKILANFRIWSQGKVWYDLEQLQPHHTLPLHLTFCSFSIDICIYLCICLKIFYIYIFNSVTSYPASYRNINDFYFASGSKRVQVELNFGTSFDGKSFLLQLPVQLSLLFLCLSIYWQIDRSISIPYIYMTHPSLSHSLAP